MKGWQTITFYVLASILPILETFDITKVVENPKVWAFYGLFVAVAGAVKNAISAMLASKSINNEVEDKNK